jgi:hypothetical protein
MEGALLALALLACPVGMGLMMWFMNKGRNKDQHRPAGVDELHAEHARLSTEIERREHEQSPTAGTRSGS